MKTEYYYLLSAILSLLLGIFLKNKDKKKIDNKKLTANQIIYSILLAYPFCLLYLWVMMLLEDF